MTRLDQIPSCYCNEVDHHGMKQHDQTGDNSSSFLVFFARSEGYRQVLETTHNPKIAGRRRRERFGRVASTGGVPSDGRGNDAGGRRPWSSSITNTYPSEDDR